MSCSSPLPSTSSILGTAAASSSFICPRIRHFVSGTFNSPFLHLFSFDTLTRSLSLLSTLPGYGPHSFLTVGRTSNAGAGILVDTVYATTWAETPELIAWRVNWDQQEVKGLEWLGNVPITATSSYVHVQPPAYASLTSPSFGVPASTSKYLFSAGGPTGEMHKIDSETGALLNKEQEILFLRGGEKDLAKADKTRKALRYGAHNVDVGPHNLAYIADVGRNSILVYSYDPSSGHLSFLNEVPSPSDHDGPRHVAPSYSGKHVFMVTEHTSFVDVFRIDSPAKGTLSHVQRVSILPDDGSHQNKDYRGDTVRLSPDGKSLFATTRGMIPSIKGYVKVWDVEEGKSSSSSTVLSEKLIYQTRNSGGKANAIEFAPRYASPSSSAAATRDAGEGSRDYAVLTDDQEGYVSVLEWNGRDLQDVATIKLPSLDSGEAQGASQAVWLS
ncbi:hypothetical protein CBS101457_002773 [Exobasidium rhododendri]|nr:hypothetical protein CBS101457_002773 [Exobasidium rhododendri]